MYALYKDTPYIGLIEEYIDELFPQSFSVWNQLSLLKFDDFKCDKYLTLEDTLSLCKDFLNTVDKDYPDFLDDGIKRGSVEFYDKEDIYDYNDNLIEGKYVGANYRRHYEEQDDGLTKVFKTISIPLEHNIYDVYTLTHEFYHTASAGSNEDTYDWSVLTESIAITYEFILFDYLSKNNICNEDNMKPIEFRLKDLLQKAERLANGLTIYKKIKSNLDDLKDTELYDFEEDEGIQKEKIDEDYRSFRKTIEYYAGILIGILTYKKYKEGKVTIDNIEDYCYALSENNQLESLEILFEKFPSKEEVKDAINFVVEDISKNKADKSLKR